jgi:hypothetical protein
MEIMSKTIQQIAAEQIAAKKETKERQAEWQRQREAEIAYKAAWAQFINACCLQGTDDQASHAITTLARMLRERELRDRLEEVAASWQSRPAESYVVGLLLEAYDGKADGAALRQHAGNEIPTRSQSHRIIKGSAPWRG